MKTDSDSKTTNLLDETLTLAHASKRVDEIADLQSRLQAAEQERDKWHQRYEVAVQHLSEDEQSRIAERLRLMATNKASKASADRWKELATEMAPYLRLAIASFASGKRTDDMQDILARVDALQQEEDAG